MFATKMFQVYRDMSPPFFSKLFRRRDISYNIRSNSNFALPNVKSALMEVKVFSTYNHFHNILRLFDVLPNFPFTTSETMGDYYL